MRHKQTLIPRRLFRLPITRPDDNALDQILTEPVQEALRPYEFRLPRMVCQIGSIDP